MDPLPSKRSFTPCDGSMFSLTKEEKAYIMKLRDGEYVDEENVLSAEERAAVDALRNPSTIPPSQSSPPLPTPSFHFRMQQFRQIITGSCNQL